MARRAQAAVKLVRPITASAPFGDAVAISMTGRGPLSPKALMAAGRAVPPNAPGLGCADDGPQPRVVASKTKTKPAASASVIRRQNPRGANFCRALLAHARRASEGSLSFRAILSTSSEAVPSGLGYPLDACTPAATGVDVCTLAAICLHCGVDGSSDRPRHSSDTLWRPGTRTKALPPSYSSLQSSH